MYVRSPDQNKQNLKVPENYGGHAFRSSGAYSDMPPPAPIEPLQTESSPESKDNNTSYGTVPYPDCSDTVFEAPPDREPQNFNLYNTPPSTRTHESSPSSAVPSIFSSLMPPSSSASTRFPFGHGLGSEELIIIAMMLMLYLADGESADNELLLLLGLLLFAG